ncbi:hypothetical protein P7C71_g5380, partial [Lecanoromycetidae sp. Uapishka_2]
MWSSLRSFHIPSFAFPLLWLLLTTNTFLNTSPTLVNAQLVTDWELGVDVVLSGEVADAAGDSRYCCQIMAYDVGPCSNAATLCLFQLQNIKVKDLDADGTYYGQQPCAL